LTIGFLIAQLLCLLLLFISWVIWNKK